MLDFNLATLGFQFINFFILMFFLYKILFNPVKTMIAKRAERIETDIRDAEKNRIETEKIKNEYASKLQEMDAKMNVLKTNAALESQQLRDQMMESAQQEIDQIKLRTNDYIKSKEAEFNQHVRDQLGHFIITIPAKMLNEMMDESLQEKFLNKSIQQLIAIGEKEKTNIQKSFKKGSKIFITSVSVLSDSVKINLERILANIVESKPAIHYHQDQSLIAGIKISFGDFIMDTSPKGQLNNLCNTYLEQAT